MRILIILSNNVPIICDLNKYFHRVLPTNLPFPFRILFNVINVRTLNLFLGIQVLFSDLCKYRDIHKSINIIKKKISATNPSQNLIMYIRLETTISHKFSMKLSLDSPPYWRKIMPFLCIYILRHN